MMREERTDYKMNRPRRRVLKNVRADPLDSACRRAGLGCNCHGIRIQVESDEFDRDSARHCPSLNSAQAVSIAGGNVEDAEGLGVRGQRISDALEEGVEPIENGPI